MAVTHTSCRELVLGAGALLYYLPNGTRVTQETSEQVGPECIVSLSAISEPRKDPSMGLALDSPLSAAGALLLPGDGAGLPWLLGQPLRLHRTQVSPWSQRSPSLASTVPLMPPLPFLSGHLWLSETRSYGIEPDASSPPGQHVVYRPQEVRLVPRACGQGPLDPPRVEEMEPPGPQRVGHPQVLPHQKVPLPMP